MSRRFRNLLVSIFVLSGVVLGIFGYFWFSGRVFYHRLKVIRVYFDDVAGLKTGDRVDVLGITKGRVLGLKLKPGKGVEVQVGLERDVVLTRDTRFAIRSLSYLGSDRYLAVTTGSADEVRDTVFKGWNEVLDLETTFSRLDRILREIDPSGLSAELRSTREEVLRLIDERLRGVESGFFRTGAGIEKLNDALDSLNSVLEILRQESSARKLLTSPELYNELMGTVKELQGLIIDIKNHPERYFRVRLFR